MESTISLLIAAAECGDESAAGKLFDELYSELHRLARRELARRSREPERDDPSAPSLYRNGRARWSLVSGPGAVHGLCRARHARTDYRSCPAAASATARRSRIYREQNRLPRAAAMLGEVEPRLRRDLPPGHYAFAALALERGLLAQAQGNSRAALVFINQAMAVLDASVQAGGQGISYVPIVLSRRSEVELEMGEPSAAETDAARALKMLQQTASAGTFSCNLGRADLALGRALEALGQHEQARQSFRSAAENLEDSVGPNHPDTRAARELATLNSPS